MQNDNLIERAQGRLEAMDETIKGAIEYFIDIYADKQLISYLLWLNEKKK